MLFPLFCVKSHWGLQPLIRDVDPSLRYDGLEAMIRIALMVYASGDGEEARNTVIESDLGAQRRLSSLHLGNPGLPLAIVFFRHVHCKQTIGCIRCGMMWNVFPVANGKRFIVDGGRPMLWQNFPAFCFKAPNVALDYEIVEWVGCHLKINSATLPCQCWRSGRECPRPGVGGYLISPEERRPRDRRGS